MNQRQPNPNTPFIITFIALLALGFLFWNATRSNAQAATISTSPQTYPTAMDAQPLTIPTATLDSPLESQLTSIAPTIAPEMAKAAVNEAITQMPDVFFVKFCTGTN